MLNAHDWIRAWEEALSKCDPDTSPADSNRNIERWNKRAERFSQVSQQSSRKKEQQKLIDWLKELGALQPGFRILDIGAGTGRYTIEFLKLGCSVVALEPAEEMVRLLKNNLEEKGQPDVTVLPMSWQQLNLQQTGYHGHFDLVFASMTPGIQRPCDLQKMIDASRHACYLSAFTASRWWYLKKIMKDVFHQTMPPLPGDLLYRFGYLYTHGYYPLTHVLRQASGTTLKTPDRSMMKENSLWMLQNWQSTKHLADKQAAKVEAYIEALTDEEINKASQKTHSMSMVWFVRK